MTSSLEVGRSQIVSILITYLLIGYNKLSPPHINKFIIFTTTRTNACANHATQPKTKPRTYIEGKPESGWILLCRVMACTDQRQHFVDIFNAIFLINCT